MFRLATTSHWHVQKSNGPSKERPGRQPVLRGCQQCAAKLIAVVLLVASQSSGKKSVCTHARRGIESQ